MVKNTAESIAELQKGITVGSRIRGLTQLGKYMMSRGTVMEDEGNTWRIKWDIDGSVMSVPKKKIIRLNSCVSIYSTNPIVQNAIASKTMNIIQARPDDLTSGKRSLASFL